MQYDMQYNTPYNLNRWRQVHSNQHQISSSSKCSKHHAVFKFPEIFKTCLSRTIIVCFFPSSNLAARPQSKVPRGGNPEGGHPSKRRDALPPHDMRRPALVPMLRPKPTAPQHVEIYRTGQVTREAPPCDCALLQNGLWHPWIWASEL